MTDINKKISATKKENKMNINLSGEVETINNAVSKRKDKVVIWGAGACAESFLNNCGFTGDFDYFVDGNKNKWNTVFLSKSIHSVDAFIKDSNQDTILLIATMYFKSVIEQLETLGYNGYVYSAFHVDYKLGQGACEGLENNIEGLKNMLADDKSAEIVNKILFKRKNLDVDYSDINEPHQYFIDEIMDKNPDAVFIDGGAYLGETIDQFIEFQNNQFKKVFSFEMDENNFRKIDSKKYGNRVEILNYGLWNEETECTYDSDTTSSSLGEGGSNVAKCTTIDNICSNEKVTFIKMDIEGAEIPALHGAYETIIKDKPQMAICLYHKPDDIFEIPFLLKKWVPEYNFYIRHHSDNFTETVLYVTL